MAHATQNEVMNLFMQIEWIILDWIQTLRNDVLDTIMPIVSMLCDFGIFPIIVGVVLLIIPKTRKTGFMVLTALAMGLLVVNLGIKPWFDRARPYEMVQNFNLLVPELSDGSFPSGHAMAAFALAVTLGYKFYRVRILFYIVALAVAFSRLYLYMHFTSDVLVGIIIGVLLGDLAIWIVNKVYRSIKKRRKAQQEGVMNDEVQKAKADAEVARAEADKAKAEVELAKAEAEKAQVSSTIPQAPQPPQAPPSV